jgi:hypothetical protein
MLSRRAASSFFCTKGGCSSSSVFSAAAASPVLFSVRRYNSDKGKQEDAEELAREQRLREMFQKGGSQPQGSPAASSTSGSKGLPNPLAGVDPKASFMDQMKQVHANAKRFAEEQTSARLGKGPGAAFAASTTTTSTTTPATSTDSSSSSSSSSSGQQQQQQQGGTVQAPPLFTATQTIWTVLIYSTAVYAIVLVWQLLDEQSFVSMTQGVPHWAINSTDMGAFLIYRVIYPYREQNRIRSEYEAAAQAQARAAGSAPLLSFADFVQQRYGSQLGPDFPEAVRLVAAASRSDFARFSRMMGDAVKQQREPMQKVTAIATALRAAGVVGGAATSGVGYGAYQQQQQQYYAQQQAAYQQQLAAFYAAQQQQMQFAASQQQQQQQQWPPAEARSAPPVANSADQQQPPQLSVSAVVIETPTASTGAAAPAAAAKQA